MAEACSTADLCLRFFFKRLTLRPTAFPVVPSSLSRAPMVAPAFFQAWILSGAGV